MSYIIDILEDIQGDLENMCEDNNNMKDNITHYFENLIERLRE